MSCLGCAFYHTGLLTPLLGSFNWGVDVLFRKVYMAHFQYPRQGTLKHIGDTVVELSFPKLKHFDYNPGQCICLAIPELSIFQWHPFIISSCPLGDEVTICIRKAGTWTKALYKLAESKQEVSILLEGPHGSVGVDLIINDRYRMIMLISGCIGATPMQSICNQLVQYWSIQKNVEKSRNFASTGWNETLLLCKTWMSPEERVVFINLLGA